MNIQISLEPWADPQVNLPKYETADATGADLRANFPFDQRAKGVSLVPLQRALVPTGLKVALPPGYEMQIRPRSGLALRNGLTLLNSPGTIDSDYRGPIGLIVINLGDQPVTISHGDRIAQAVIAPVVQAVFELSKDLDQTERGDKGFGSTGVQ